MISISDIAARLCAAAGWRRPEPDGDGRLVFGLEGDLIWELLTPDGWTVVFLADLGAWPEERPEDLCRRLAVMAAAAFPRRRSVLSLKDGRFRLHHTVSPLPGSLEELPDQCAAFLNDCAWWRANWPTV